MNTITQQDVAEKLLYSLFRCLDETYKKKYFKGIWEQFENNVRASAYTSRLSVFLQSILSTMPIALEKQYLKGVNEIVGCGQDRVILNWLRDETTYLVLMARMANEQRKEEFKQTIITETE
jgi:hypothetical protein